MEGHPNILVADDEQAIADLVVALLSAEGMDACACYTGEDALSQFAKGAFDLVILDIMMPGADGFSVCRHIRGVSDVPIIFLSAKDEEADKVIGLTIGADDYIAKPFKPRELVARVKARLRRSGRSEKGSQPSVIGARGIAVDLDAHCAHLHDIPLHLTPKEFELLALLIRAGGRPVTTKDIFEAIWEAPFDASSSNTIMVHIRNLRKKLAAIDASEAFIETAWGVGYRIAPEQNR